MSEHTFTKIKAPIYDYFTAPHRIRFRFRSGEASDRGPILIFDL